MANYDHINVSESHESRQISRTNAESVVRQSLVLCGPKTLKEAERFARQYKTPDDIDRFDFDKATLTLDTNPKFFDILNPANNVIEIERTYTLKESVIEWRLSMTTQTATCTTARRAIAAVGSFPFWDAKDYDKGGSKEGQEPGAGSPINVRKVNGKQETGGIEIAVPSYKLTVAFECPEKKWDKLKKVLIRSAGSVNSDDFQDWKAGELLFSGFESNRNTEKINVETGEPEVFYQVDYTFDVSINEDYAAGDFTIPAKDISGFSVKWSYYGEEEEFEYTEAGGSEKVKNTRPKCTGAYASEVYPRVPFASLIPSGISLD